MKCRTVIAWGLGYLLTSALERREKSMVLDTKLHTQLDGDIHEGGKKCLIALIVSDMNNALEKKIRQTNRV